jgi:cell division protein FtsB
VFGLSLVRSISRVNQANRRIQEAKDKVTGLKNESKTLEDELKVMQSDAYLQAQLRNKLGLAREGETVIVLPDPESLRGLVPQIPEEEDMLPDPIWKRWAKLFGV